MLQTLQTPGDSSWFTQARFGMFIHWGLYSMAARHEWIRSIERISDADYRNRYFKHFDPDLYNPDVWAQAASDAGMKYFVVTAKHHEGFCLWDSKHTDYKATNTPAGRDLLRPMVDAFRSRNMRVGLYYSLLDWIHPHYVVDYQQHPRRDELPPSPNFSGDQWPYRNPRGDGSVNNGRDQSIYAAYMRAQVEELLTAFGQIDALWFDFTFVNPKHRLDFTFGKGREAWESEKLYALIRKLAPNILLTDRLDLDLPLSGGDFKTPEQATPPAWVTVDINGVKTPVVWESCQTLSGSWGYHRDEQTFRDTPQLIRTLIDCVSKGGNLLLNIGPTGRGEIDERALSRLSGVGQWMNRHNRSIYGCTQAPAEFTAPEHCRLTYNPETHRLYVHLFAWPYKMLHLKGRAFQQQVEYAQLLHDGSEVGMGLDHWHQMQIGDAAGEALALNLPQSTPNVAVPVIELFLKRP